MKVSYCQIFGKNYNPWS